MSLSVIKYVMMLLTFWELEPSVFLYSINKVLNDWIKWKKLRQWPQVKQVSQESEEILEETVGSV